MSSTTSARLKYRCPICEKGFSSRSARKNHTGTKSPGSAIAHRCSLCSQQFCSERALLQHKSSPSHDTMFKCDECERPFRSNQGLRDHQRAKGHVATGWVVVSAPVIGLKSPRGAGMGAMGGLNIDGLAGQMMGMQLDGSLDLFDGNWTLCDKDCGWCGRCAGLYGY